MNISLSGKNILVTGGTGTLGSIFVERALEEDAHVFFSFHKDKSCAGKLGEKGAIPLSCDIGERSQIDSLKAELEGKCDRLDVLVHCAAALKDHTVQNLKVEDWDRIIEVNLSSVYYLTKQLLPLFRRSKQGRIIILTSRAGIKGGFGQANYAASKAGLIALTKTMAQELGRKGILVNALNPGFMLSKMNEGLSEELREKNRTESYLRRHSDPREVADFMIYLLSDHVSGVTGQVFHYDSRLV